MFLVSNGSVPNSQAGLGLPVTYDEESFEIVRRKLTVLKSAFGCDLLLENGAVFTPVPDTEMSEPQFLNRLYSEVNCGTLLDLHNLYVGLLNGSCRRRNICSNSIRIVFKRSTWPEDMSWQASTPIRIPV